MHIQHEYEYGKFRGNNLLKRPGVQIEWTPKMFEEWVKCSKDPIYFIENYMNITDADGNVVKLILRNYQKEIILSYLHNRNTITTTSRQSGKTTTTTGFILWYIIFQNNKNVAILANKAEVAQEILDRIQYAYEGLPKWIQQGVVEWNKRSIVLENGSRIRAAATSKSAIRGFTVHCLYIDEAAHVENWNEFYTSSAETISSGKETKILLTSCVTENTYVFSNHGLCQIKDFIDYKQIENPKLGYNVNDYMIYGHKKFNNGSIMVNSGKAPTRIISTSSASLECSYEHKLWACKNGNYGWYKSSELEENDYISIEYGMNIYGNDDISNIIVDKSNKIKNIPLPDKITKDWAYFFGLFLAEGYMRPIYNKLDKTLTSGQITITCGDDISYIYSSLGIKYKKYDDVHYTTNSKQLYQFLTQFGFDPTLKAKNKIIPNKILSLSKDNICSFLSGLFDGDGCANKRKGTISYVSASEELINQVRMLLLNIGILTQKYTNVIPPSKKVKVYSTVHVLEICNYDDCLMFYDVIGFNLKRKQDRKQYLIYPNKKITKDIIPFGREIFKNISKNGVSKTNKHISRKKCLELNFIKDGICEPTLKWEKIKNIKNSENFVYDFSLNHINDDSWCHSVVYNGILGHQTPNGLNHFWEIWTNAIKHKNNFNPIEVPWTKVPGRDEKWKQETLARLNFDYEKFRQEHENQFLGSSGTLIAGWKLQQLQDTIRLPIVENMKLKQFEKPEKNHNYVLVADVSRGKGMDHSAFSIIDATTMPYKQIASFYDNLISPVEYAEVIFHTAKSYNMASILIEVNDIGGQIGDIMHHDYEYENLIQTENHGRLGKKVSFGFTKATDRGIRTTKTVKTIGCAILKLLIEQDKLIIHDSNTVMELATFSKKGETQYNYEAEEGKHDDLVMGLVLFGWLVDQGYFKELTDINTLARLREKSEEQMMEDLLPFGFIDDGRTETHDGVATLPNF